MATSGVLTQMVGMAALVLQLGGGAIDLALVSAMTFLPVFVGGIWAGALADRVDRRRLLLTTQLLFLLVATALSIVSLTGSAQLWILFVLSFAGGCVFAADGPVRQVYVLDLVGSERAASAVGLYEVVQNVSRVLGPAVGGLLVATIGISACFIVNATLYLAPIAALLRYRPAHGLEPAPRSEHGHIKEGLRYVRSSPAIRATMLMAIASGMIFNAAVTLPLVATRVFHLGASGFGAMFATFGVGAVGGALLAAGGGPWPAGRRVRLLGLLTGVDVVLTGFAPDAPAAFVGLALAGLLSIWFIALANTLVQVRTSAGLRGRVMGIWTMAIPGMNPLTGLLAGATAATLGPREGYALGGLVLAAMAALGWRSLADGGIAVAPCGPERAGDVHRLTQAAFALHQRLDPPSGAGRESVEQVAADLAKGGGAVAEEGGRVIGCLRWDLAENGDFHVRRVAVDPAAQGRGVGRELMAWAEVEARRRSCDGVSVGVRIALPGNVAFYRGLGYEVTGEHSHEGYEQPTWFSMRKRVAP